MSRNARLGALAALVLVALIVVLVNVVQGQQVSPQDKSLKATAQRFAATLRAPDSRYAAVPDSLQAFDLFQHDQQALLQSRMKALTKPGQFAQILVWETKTMPPTSLLLKSTKEPAVTVSGDAVTKATQGEDTYTDVAQGSTRYRVYVTALQPPPTIKAMEAHEILEVLAPAD
jgi:hypothetical protein